MKIFSVRHIDGEIDVRHKCETVVARLKEKQFMPQFCDELDCVFVIAAKVSRVGRSIRRQYASRYRDEMTAGVEMWSSNLAKELSSKQLSNDIAHTFDNSVLLPLPFNAIGSSEYSCYVNGEKQGVICWSDAEKIVDDAISHISKYVTLKLGDVIMVEIDKLPSYVVKRGDRVGVALNENAAREVVIN